MAAFEWAGSLSSPPATTFGQWSSCKSCLWHIRDCMGRPVSSGGDIVRMLNDVNIVSEVLVGKTYVGCAMSRIAIWPRLQEGRVAMRCPNRIEDV